VTVYDAFLFSGEFDLLYLRVSELDPIVDYFMVVEATTTFQGEPRSVVPLESDTRLAPFLHKLHHVVVDDLPRGSTPWIAEYVQRNALSRVLSSAAPTDLVMLSDVDEIPSRPAIEMALTRPLGEILALEMRFFYYGFNWETPARWDRARAVRAKILQSVSPQELRSFPYPDTVIREAGWHLSYFYKRKDIVERIKAKANSFSHREYASEKYLNDRYLAFCATTGLSWCSSPRYAVKLHYRDIGIAHPEQVRKQGTIWGDYCLPAIDRDKFAEARANVLHAASFPWQKIPPNVQRAVSERVRRVSR
jgi:beta-1,4-mannosyl-glycoprotein beta-1,4-N-acetylglucosaminyltransferase